MSLEDERPPAGSKDTGFFDAAAKAQEMLDQGFTKPIIVDFLATAGVDREQARQIVTDLVKARYRQDQSVRTEVNNMRAWKYMLVGGFTMLCGALPMVDFFYRLHTQGVAYFHTNYWWLFTAGFFIFLFGLTRKKRPQ